MVSMEYRLYELVVDTARLDHMRNCARDIGRHQRSFSAFYFSMTRKNENASSCFAVPE